MTKPCLFASVVLSVTCHLTGQTTLTVGPNGQYSDLPPAVAAAQPGDRIVCDPSPTIYGYTAPYITRGITIEGGGFAGLIGHMSILGVPAGEQVVVTGFASGGPLSIRIWDCLGRVHLDQLGGSNNWLAVNQWASISVADSAAVSLHEVATHGSPAVSVSDSIIVIDHCRFGTFAGGPDAGGGSVEALRSTVTVIQPADDPGNAIGAPYYCIDSALTIAGRFEGTFPPMTSGHVISPLFNGVPTAAFVGFGTSTLRLSPDVNIGQTGGATGFAQYLVARSPYHDASSYIAGNPVRLYTFDLPGAIGVAALSPATMPAPTSLGDLWIDPLQAATYAFLVGANGEHFVDVPVPATLPTGSAFTLQGATLRTNGAIELSLPTTFSVRN